MGKPAEACNIGTELNKTVFNPLLISSKGGCVLSLITDTVHKVFDIGCSIGILKKPMKCIEYVLQHAIIKRVNH